MIKCPKCGKIFGSEKRLKIHYKTHEKKELKNKIRKHDSHLPDFEKPDFSQVM